jgi:predicted amidohydrolase YtcJ
LDNDLLKELRELGLWASVQPNFAGRWSVPGGLNEQRLGKERLARCNAYKSILDNKIPFSFGSDSMPLGPLFGIKSAIFHPVEEQRMSQLDAIKAYTLNGYALLDQESKLGKIAPGKLADIVILNKDPFITGDSEFDDIKIVGTIFNGELVYSDGLEFR